MHPLSQRFDGVTIDPLAVFFGRLDRLEIGSGSRIDAFCVITIGPEGVILGRHVHLGAGAQVFGTGGAVRLDSCSGLSPRASLFTATDDLRGDCLTGATIDPAYRNVRKGSVILEPYACVGCGSVVLPGVTLGRGAAVGALSLVKRDVPAWHVVAGADQRVIAVRNGQIVEALGQQWLGGPSNGREQSDGCT